MDEIITIKTSPKGRLYLILETTAGSRAPLVISVVEVVPVELRLVVVQPEIRHPIRPVARANLFLPIPILSH